jgi:hypothetical protein
MSFSFVAVFRDQGSSRGLAQNAGLMRTWYPEGAGILRTSQGTAAVVQRGLRAPLLRTRAVQRRVAQYAGLGCTSSVFSINPHGEPVGQPCFVQVAGCHGEHCPDGLLCRNM